MKDAPKLSGSLPRTVTPVVVAVLALAGSSALLAQAIFGTARLQAPDPPADTVWALRTNAFPYPKELAKDAISGCLIAEMTVTKSGKAKNVDVLYSFPAGGIERHFKRSLNRIRWDTIDDDVEGKEERREVRVDFCTSYASQEEARAVCEVSAGQGCG